MLHVVKAKSRYDCPVGPNLQRLRQGRYTQASLALALGVALRTVQNWEQRTTEPSWSQVVRIAEALGVEPMALYAQEVQAA